MGRFERSIKFAFDKGSGEILNADKIFDKQKDAFKVRTQFHKDEVELYCCECGQKLNVSTSKRDRLHFKHHPKAAYCILKDGNLTQEEIEKFGNILAAKESQRHKDLKNRIALGLLSTDGVEADSITVDDKFIVRDGERRRPDVYCRYNGKELIFEIQLSNLSLRYILSRYEFYQKHGMYLIWVLENFDIHDQGQLERDIKYLTRYENFFKLDEKAEGFKLICDFKRPFLTQDNLLHSKWQRCAVALDQVNFDTENHQIFYYNYDEEKSKLQANQKVIEERLLMESAKDKVGQIIRQIRDFRKSKAENFEFVNILIERLDEFELNVLNEELKLGKRDKSKKPALNEWICTAKRDDYMFLDFILKCEAIEIEVNERDSDGKSAFQEIHENQALDLVGHVLTLGLLRRGYKLTEDDEKCFMSQANALIDRWINYSICNRLSNREMVEDIEAHLRPILIIESARRGGIIGFNYKPTEWIAFANNAVQYYGEYWTYIERAFRGYGIWQLLLNQDKKGTFKGKLQKLKLNFPFQSLDFDEVFRDLYPELSTD